MYKVYIQNMSDASRTLIYSSNANDSLIEEPKVSFEWDQPVTFSFSMYPEHPSYNDIIPIVTFVTVEWDNDELFFGRVLTAEPDLFKRKEIYCEGALSFLSDGEIPEYENTVSIASFFAHCITEYNQTVESRKQFSIGTVDFTESSVYFKVEKHADPKSVLDDQLVNRFGGCIVIKKTANGHSINYLKQVGSEKTGRIQLGENVKDRVDHYSGESVFSILRPIGGTKSGENEPVVITSNNGLIEIPDMISKYGRIIKKENFSDQFTEEGLRSAAMAFISRLGMANDKLPFTVDIGYVDFCYLNPSISRIYFGDVFTDIEGYSGEAMAVGRLELDLSNPANDSLSLYNKTYLDAREYSAILNSSTGSTSGSRGGRGGGGSALAGLLSDMEQEQTDVLNIGGENIKRLNIHANSVDGYITLSSHQISLQSEVLFGSNRTYDMISTDVEEMWGSQVHADGNGFWNLYGTVVKDDSGRIVVKGDSGLAVEKTDDQGRKVTVGVYDELGLTAGLLVDKINSDSTTYLLGDRLILSNVSYSYNVVRPELSDNPKALGYYELQNGSYVLTSDLERVSGKNYYIKKYSVGPGGDTIGSRIEKETNRISLVVEGYGNNAHIKPAAIVESINDSESSILLSADKIRIDGDVTLSGAMGVSEGSLWIKKAVIAGSAGNYVTINNGSVNAKHLQVNSGGNLAFAGSGMGAFKTVGYSDVIKFVTGFGASSASGGQISIPYYTVGSGSESSAGTINFNIADTEFYSDTLSAFQTALGDAGWSGYNATQISAALDTANKRLAIYSAVVNVALPGQSSATQYSIGLGDLDLTTPLNNYYQSAYAEGRASATPSIGKPYINNPDKGYIRAAVTVNGSTYYGDSIKLTNDKISGWGGPV